MSEENTENKKPSNIESALEEETETVEQPVLTELRNVDVSISITIILFFVNWNFD